MRVGDDLEEAVGRMLDRHWVEPGYTTPNDEVYPWQWLWDSCFHALIWHRLDRPDRAVTELTAALSTQDGTGFVPHMNYQRGPDVHADLWGREGASTITQPPMYGHAVADLLDAGVAVPAELVDRAHRGLRFLLDRRRRSGDGLVELCHPWESGADDSPRWDDLCPGGFDLARWRRHKNDLVTTIRFEDGAPVANPRFAVGSIGFNALIAHNCRRLAASADRADLATDADRLAAAIETRWRDDRWVDGGPTEHGSGRVRTADSMLALLVVSAPEQRDRAWAAVDDPAAFGGRFGPRGVHRAEAVFDPTGYWRGPCWPQLAYLLWWAAADQGRADTAGRLASSTRSGAVESGWAEYWNADSGAGLGAVPQSWSGLVLLMDRSAAIAPRG